MRPDHDRRLHRPGLRGDDGTPNQRERAYAFGASLAAAAKPKSYVLPSPTVAALFEDELPTMVAPDAP